MITEINKALPLLLVKSLKLTILDLQKLRKRILNNVLLFPKNDVPVQSRTRA